MTKGVVTGTIAATMSVVLLPFLGVVADDAATPPPSQLAAIEIPPALLARFETAGRKCDGLEWEDLAGIAWVETRMADGRADAATGWIDGDKLLGYQSVGADTDLGALDGDSDRDWAVGLMQLTPATFRSNAMLGEGRAPNDAPDPSNAWDAIATAGNLMCALLHEFGDVKRAVQAYNCGSAASVTCGLGYADQVMAKSEAYRRGTASGVTVAGDIGRVVQAALAQLGKPYVFGAVGPDAFDCSGLVVWAFRAAGIALPHYTHDLVELGTPVAVDQIQPGDLVFTRGGVPVADFGHVGIALDRHRKIVAPQTGENVQIQTIIDEKVQAVRRLVVGESELK